MTSASERAGRFIAAAQLWNVTFLLATIAGQTWAQSLRAPAPAPFGAPTSSAVCKPRGATCRKNVPTECCNGNRCLDKIGKGQFTCDSSTPNEGCSANSDCFAFGLGIPNSGCVKGRCVASPPGGLCVFNTNCRNYNNATGKGGCIGSLCENSDPPQGSAPGALAAVPLVKQKTNSQPLQTAYCQRALDFTYEAYSYTGNWTLVPQPPFNDGQSYIFTYTLPQVGISSNNMTAVMHTQLPLGLTVQQYIDGNMLTGTNAAGTLDSYEQLVALARPVESMDKSLYSGVLTTTGPGPIDVYVLGMVVYGKSDADLGKKFVVNCIMDEKPHVTTQ